MAKRQEGIGALAATESLRDRKGPGRHTRREFILNLAVLCLITPILRTPTRAEGAKDRKSVV